MAKKAKTKFSVFALAMFALIVVSMIMVIVGYTLNWISNETVGRVTTLKLADLIEGNDNPSEGLATMNTFAIITFIMAIASTVCYALSAVLNIKLFKLITALVGVATLILAVVLIITTFSYCGNYDVQLGSTSINEASPAIGPWFMTIFGVIGGGATAVGAMKG